MPVPSFVAGTALRRLPVSGAPPRGFAYDFAPEPYPDGQWRLSPGHVLSVSLRAAPGRVAGPVPPVSTRVALLRPPPLQVQIARSLAMLQPFSTAEGPGVGTGPSHAMMHCRALRRPLAALAVSAVLVALACATSQVGGAALPLRCPGLFAFLCVCVLSSLPLATASPSDLQGIVSLHVVVDSRCDNDHGTAGTTCA